MRDHLLGFPAVLLALDPEPPKPASRTPLRPRLTDAEQAQRRAMDVPPAVVVWPIGETRFFKGGDSVPECVERVVRGTSKVCRARRSRHLNGSTDCAGQAPAKATSGGADPIQPCLTPDPAPPAIPEGAMWEVRNNPGQFYRWTTGGYAECWTEGDPRWSSESRWRLDEFSTGTFRSIPGVRIPHDGGPCPVPPETRIAAIWHDDGEIRCMAPSIAGSFYWSVLVAYEVAE